MDDTGKITGSSTRWTSGWVFAASALSSRIPDAPDVAFRAANALGDLIPDRTSVPWSFHLGLSAESGPVVTTMLANGFRLAMNRRGQHQTAACIMPEPGLLLGSSIMPIDPVLFSGEQEIHREHHLQWLADGDRLVVLASNRTGPQTRFCLAVSTGRLNEIVERVNPRLSDDAQALFTREFETRRTLLDRYTEDPSFYPVVSYALETLIAHLHPPSSSFPFRWSMAGVQTRDEFDANQVLPLVTAWCQFDPTVADEIVRGVLACQHEDGALPARVNPGTGATVEYPMWPFITQAVHRVWLATQNRELLEYALPRIRRHLVWALRYYDPQHCGVHSWQTTEESFIPQTFDPGLLTADLSAFLLCEIGSFLKLSDVAQHVLEDRTFFLSERDRLVANLENTFWSQAQQNFPDRHIGSLPVEPVTISAIMPLLWGRLAPRYRDSLLIQISSSDFFSTRNGAPLWLYWEGNATPPPIPSMHQFFLLEALRRSGARHEILQFVRQLTDSLGILFRHYRCLPDDLRLAAQFSESNGTNREEVDPGKEAQNVVPSALALVLASVSLEQTGHAGVSPRLKWLDRHGKTVVGSALAFVTILLISVIMAYMNKRLLPPSTLHPMIGLAQQYYAEGNYNSAIETFQYILNRAPALPSLEIWVGNAFYKRGDFKQAEQYYRSILNRNTINPVAQINLALTLYRQGRIAESREYYEKVVKEFNLTSPSVANRARFALALMKNQESGFSVDSP